MKKKTARLVCIILAALMLLTTFGMLFAQFTYAASVFRVSSPPEFYNYKSSNGSNLPRIRSGGTYHVKFEVLDTSHKYLGPDFDADFKNGYAAMGDGNFSSYEPGTISLASDQTIGDYLRLIVEFDSGDSGVKYDGKGKTLSVDLAYSYKQEVKPIPSSSSSSEDGGETIELNDEGSSTSMQSLDSSEPEKQYESVDVSGSISIPISQAVLDSSSSSSSDDEESESYRTATPNVIITSYSYGGIDVLSGSEFPLTITFQNTSDELDLENVILDLVTSTGLAVSSGSNSAYLEKLAAGESQTRQFKMMALANLEKIEPQQITAKFTYEYILDKTRKAAERTEVLAVPVTQVDRFDVGELSVPDQMWPGDSTYFSIEYVNKGKGVISNLAAKLETNVPGVGETQNIGNVPAGDSGSIDFNITVNDPGTVEGKVIITYEDLKGQEQTIELPFTSTVMAMNGFDDGDMGMIDPMPMPEDTGIPTATKVMAVVGGLMVAALTGTVVVKKVKAKREEEQDEDI